VIKKIQPTSIRIPEDLRLWLGHRAVDRRSTISKEVLDILRKEKEREGEITKC